MVTLTISTPLGELTSVKLSASVEDAVARLKEGKAIDVELDNGRTAYIPVGMLEQSVIFIDSVE